MARSPELGSQDIALAVRETREWLEVSIVYPVLYTPLYLSYGMLRHPRILSSVLPAAGGDGAAFPGRPLFPCGPGGRRAAVRVSLCSLHAVRQRATTSLLHACSLQVDGETEPREHPQDQPLAVPHSSSRKTTSTGVTTESLSLLLVCMLRTIFSSFL